MSHLDALYKRSNLSGSSLPPNAIVGKTGIVRRILTINQSASFLTVFALGFFILMTAGAVAATTISSGSELVIYFPMEHIATFLFLMLGPSKIIGPFVKLTAGADAALERKIALLSITFSTIALLIAGLLGEMALRKHGVPLPILALAGGIILFLVAIKDTIQQFALAPSETADTQTASPTMKTAINPLAFPVIVTPYGIAALIVFLAFAPDIQGQLMIGAMVFMIMLLNFLAMIFARKLLAWLGIVLAIVGAVLGVVQVALGLQIISNSFKALGVG